jgi:asparaginyl-tRNA synthetase
MPKCGGEGNGASTRSRQYYDGRTVAAMDVLAPGIGGIIGGSQREERPEVLDERMAESGIDQEHHPSLPREWTRVGRVRV